MIHIGKLSSKINEKYCKCYLPVSPARMELENEKLFFKSDVSTSNIRAEIVQPPQSAALSGSL